MADLSPPNGLPLVISSQQRFGPTTCAQLASPAHSSTAWPAANQAIYIPVSIPFYFPVARVFWVNGSTVTGNKDFGIYTWDGAKIYSTGSTAESGASAVQYVSVSGGLVLAPGSYFFGISCSGTTNHLAGNTAVTTNIGRLGGLLQQASALPLPSTATFAAWASTGLPDCGVSRV